MANGKDEKDGPGYVRLWNLKSGKLLQEYGEKKIRWDCRAVSPDGKLGLFGHYERDAIVFDLENGKPVWTFKQKVPNLAFTPICFSPDGRKILIERFVRTRTPCYTLEIWDLKERKKHWELARSFNLRKVFWPTENHFFLATDLTEGKGKNAEYGLAVEIFDLESGNKIKGTKIFPSRLPEVRKIEGVRLENARVGNFSFSWDEKRLVFFSLGHLVLWNLETDRVEQCFLENTAP